jgi:hypothetical protein
MVAVLHRPDLDSIGERGILVAFVLAMFGLFVALAGHLSAKGSSSSCTSSLIGLHLLVFSLLSITVGLFALWAKGKIGPVTKVVISIVMLPLVAVLLAGAAADAENLQLHCL